MPPPIDDIALREKIQWTKVPFKATAESVTALRGGHVNAVAGGETAAFEKAAVERLGLQLR